MTRNRTCLPELLKKSGRFSNVGKDKTFCLTPCYCHGYAVPVAISSFHPPILPVISKRKKQEGGKYGRPFDIAQGRQNRKCFLLGGV